MSALSTFLNERLRIEKTHTFDDDASPPWSEEGITIEITGIIDRDCHVGCSNRSVIRHVVSKMRSGSKTYRAMPRDERRLLMQQCIRQHRENRELYAAVMYPTYRPVTEEDAS